MAKPMTLDYLAAYFDAIGSVHFNHKESANPVLRVLTYCQDEPTLEAMYNMIPVGLTNKVKPQNRITYRWMIIARDETLRFLQAVEPHVRVKRELVSLGVDYLMQQKVTDGIRNEFRGRLTLTDDEEQRLSDGVTDLLELRDDIITASVAIRGRVTKVATPIPMLIKWGVRIDA
jgi:hypothetical protein